MLFTKILYNSVTLMDIPYMYAIYIACAIYEGAVHPN